MKKHYIKKQYLKSTVSILISAFLASGLLYAGVPVAAEDGNDPETVEIEDTYENYETTEPTGWYEEIPESEIPAVTSEITPETTLVQADLTEEGVYQSLISMQSVYPEGMTWTNANSYAPYYHYRSDGRKVYYTGYGCAGFAFHLSNAAFGDLKDREHYNWDDIRVGDILRVNNDQHSVIVLKVSGNDITVAEGNYNSKIHWGRVISRSYLKSGYGTYIWTRWPEGSVNTNVTSISLSNSSIQDVEGSYYRLSATVYPSTASDTSVSWTTSNSNVAVITTIGSSYADIYLMGPGTCTITCTSKQNSAIKATCTVKVANYERLEAFATRLYNKCLGRNPDEEGLEHWIEVLASGERTGADVAKGFVFSKEYTQKNTSDDDYVEMLYNVFMDRASDADGKAHWLNYLSQGLSREYVFRGFAQSAEYTKICDAYGITRGSVTLTQARDQNPNLTMYVSRLYTQALGRAYDVDGLNHWCKTIQAGVKTPQEVAESFINSKEFQNKNLSNTEYIKTLYRTFMGREYDQAGLDHWISEMNNGCSRQNILSRFAGSKEFRNIQASFGL